MEKINGYSLTTEWTNSANGDFAFATKGSMEYFIKRLPSPTYPLKKFMSEESFKKNVKYCENWEREKKGIIYDLNKASSKCPYLITPKELFRYGNKYYLATQKVTGDVLSFTDICEAPQKEKYKLLSKLIDCLIELDRVHIVHGDLKHPNVLVVKEHGEYEPRMIDFDSCYYAQHPPSAEDTIGSLEYYSPELGRHITENTEKSASAVTCKSDIFAMGLMFNEYLTGKSAKCARFKYPYLAKYDSDFILSTKDSKEKDLLMGMLAVKADKRKSLEELKDDLEYMITGHRKTEEKPSFLDRFKEKKKKEAKDKKPAEAEDKKPAEAEDKKPASSVTETNPVIEIVKINEKRCKMIRKNGSKQFVNIDIARSYSEKLGIPMKEE